MDSNSPETNGINKAMIAVVSVFILGLVIWGVASPEGLDNAMNATLGWVTTNLGWLFLVVVLFFVIAMIIVMISKWGRIRLGGDDAKPEYSTWAWFAMLFAAAMGIGLVFWGVSEPLCHYFSPPFGEPASGEAVTYAGKFGQEMAKRGFPMRDGGSTQAPFDTLGDFFRGTRGIMMDMYRRPEKLLKALDVLTPWMVQMGVAGGKKTGNPRIFIPLHKGSDSFMSDEQFKTFYWPSLQKLIIALVDEGMNPSLFVEADHTSRLEVMRDVPAGKVIYHMENTDMFKAKEILGDRVCLRGNVPISMLCLGTPDDVKAYCKKLIDVVGKNGGLIMDSSVGIEDAKVENIKAMIDFTKEYGVYR
jgi:hypothetical protein